MRKQVVWTHNWGLMHFRKYQSREGVERIAITYDFLSIDYLLQQLGPGQIGVVYGRSVVEVLSSYTHRLGLGTSATSLSGNESYSVRQIAANRTALYARYRYKVDSFLHKVVPARPVLVEGNTTTLFQSPIELASRTTWTQLRSYLLSEYLRTRRIKEGADQEFLSYMRVLERATVKDPVILRSLRDFSYDDLIALWHALHSDPAVRTVLVFDHPAPLWAFSGETHTVERDYISVGELIDSSSHFFDLSVDAVKSTFRVWISSNDRAAEQKPNGKLTQALAEQFLSVLSTGSVQQFDENTKLVPLQQIAPLRFEVKFGRFDLLQERQYREDEPRVRGAVVTCIAAVDDLLSYNAFSNAIPTFAGRITRISSILDRIYKDVYDDELIVQLGTELLSLERRVSAADGQLGEISVGEAASFFAVLKAFVGQFSVWSEYQAQISGDAIAPNEESINAARSILADIEAVQGLATDLAKGRAGELNQSIPSDDISGEVAEGALVSAENAASQAASSVVLYSKREGLKLTAGLRKKGKEEANDRIVKWFFDNTFKFRHLAQLRNIEWLQSFLDRFNP